MRFPAEEGFPPPPRICADLGRPDMELQPLTAGNDGHGEGAEVWLAEQGSP